MVICRESERTMRGIYNAKPNITIISARVYLIWRQVASSHLNSKCSFANQYSKLLPSALSECQTVATSHLQVYRIIDVQFI